EAFPSFSKTTSKERIDLLNRIVEEYEKRKDDLIQTVTKELGVPLKLSETAHYNMGMQHFKQAAKELETFEFEKQQSETLILQVSIGVSCFITPSNYPTDQTSTKIASAFVEGSTVVLKPSELTLIVGNILADVFEAAVVSKGVLNLVNET